jgi:FKBP-type peptidyl-prolyl cis-trans isomerase
MRIANLYAGSLVAAMSLLCGCGDDGPPKDNSHITQHQVNESLIKSHQMYVKQEADEIQKYIANHNFVMQATSTGIYYMITQHGSGEQPKVKDIATVSYTISLLDGTICYDSKTEGPKQFKVGQDEVESGVHQAVQLMHLGDRGTFIIPSGLAQGLVGDRDKIPPGAVVIYDMTLIAVKKGE